MLISKQTRVKKNPSISKDLLERFEAQLELQKTQLELLQQIVKGTSEGKESDGIQSDSDPHTGYRGGVVSAGDFARGVDEQDKRAPHQIYKDTRNMFVNFFECGSCVKWQSVDVHELERYADIIIVLPGQPG